MSHRTTFASRIADTVGRWLPGMHSIASAAAAAGDPALLLDLETQAREHDDPRGAG